MEKQSGALYVRLGETLHPVLNLASARLIVKTNADPQPTAESALSPRQKGSDAGHPRCSAVLGHAARVKTNCGGRSATAATACRHDSRRWPR